MKTFTIDPTQFLVETMHLTTWEVGAYVLLMANQAAREKPILIGHMRTVSRVGPEADLDDVPFVDEFMDSGEREWSHPDIARQIAERDKAAEFNTERARKASNARHHGKHSATSPELDAAFKVLLPAAPVAQRIEQGSSNSSVAGSSPAGRTTPDTVDEAIEQRMEEGRDEAETARESMERASIGSHLPDDFALTGTMIAEAKVKGVDDMGLLADIFDEFRKYHITAATISPDWPASWDKWFERKKPKKPRAAPRVQLSNEQPSADD